MCRANSKCYKIFVNKKFMEIQKFKGRTDDSELARLWQTY